MAETDLGPLTKVSINFLEKSMEALEAAAEQTGDNRTDTLNRAIQAYARVVQLHDRGRGGGRFHIWQDGRWIRVEIDRPWWRFW